MLGSFGKFERSEVLRFRQIDGDLLPKDPLKLPAATLGTGYRVKCCHNDSKSVMIPRALVQGPRGAVREDLEAVMVLFSSAHMEIIIIRPPRGDKSEGGKSKMEK